MALTMKEAKALREMIEAVAQKADLSAQEALAASDLFPAWDASGTYAVGTRVRYADALYSCVQAHTAQSDWAPDTAVSLWSEVKIDASTGYDEWTQPTGAQDAYNKGDRVSYNGKIYESAIDANVYSPEAYPAGWTEVEA